MSDNGRCVKRILTTRPAEAGRCDGCGEIICREDYERGECRWCGRRV